MAKQKQNKRKSTFISLYIWTGATWMTSAKKKYNTIQEKEVKETCPTYGVEDCWEVKKNFEFHLQTNFSQKFKLDQQNWSFFSVKFFAIYVNSVKPLDVFQTEL